MTSNYVMLINNEFRRMLDFGQALIELTITDIAKNYRTKLQKSGVVVLQPMIKSGISAYGTGNHNSNLLLVLNVFRSSFTNINIIMNVKLIIYISTKIYCMYF